MKATIRSEKGFYVGDPCYVLDEEFYHKVWGEQHHFEDGCFEHPETGLSFAVAGTCYGDGCYEGKHCSGYGVDSGTISIVPLELCVREKYNMDALGHVFPGGGTAVFESNDGVFDIKLPGGVTEHINTDDEEDYDNEEEDDEDD